MTTAMQPSSSKQTFRFRPAVDVFESEDSFLFVAEVPGISQDELELTVEQGVLRIASEREDGDWDYARSFNLPEIADAESVEANLKDGVLSVTVGKQASKLPRKVKISVE